MAAGRGLTTFDERDAACCYAKPDNIWAHDPDGNAWEIYALLDDLDEDPNRDHTGRAHKDEDLNREHTGRAHKAAEPCCSPASFMVPSARVVSDGAHRLLGRGCPRPQDAANSRPLSRRGHSARVDLDRLGV